MEKGLQTPAMIDQDQDKMVDKQDLTSTVGFWRKKQSTDDRSKDEDKGIFNPDRAIGDIMLNSKLFNTISITNPYQNLYEIELDRCSRTNFDKNQRVTCISNCKRYESDQYNLTITDDN